VVRLPCSDTPHSDVLFLTYLVENTSAVIYRNNNLIGLRYKIVNSSDAVGHPLK
jgi:hypothetical protein